MNLMLAKVKCNGSWSPVEGLQDCGLSKPGCHRVCLLPSGGWGSLLRGVLERAFPGPGMLLNPPGAIYPRGSGRKPMSQVIVGNGWGSCLRRTWDEEKEAYEGKGSGRSPHGGKWCVKRGGQTWWSLHAAHIICSEIKLSRKWLQHSAHRKAGL